MNIVILKPKVAVIKSDFRIYTVYDRVQEGMSWFVTKLTHFSSARKTASSAPRDATGMEIAWNHVCYLVIDVSEAQLLRPNSFCRRSFSAQL